MMESSSNSSTSTKYGLSVSTNSRMKQITKSAIKEKKRPIVDSYRYLATGLSKQQVPKMGKSKSHQMSDSDIISFSKLAENHFEKKQNRSETNTDVKTMKNLAKEMGKMLANAKSKGHTNELLQLFKNTLNNFVAEKHQRVTASGEGSELNQKKLLKMRPMKPRPVVEHDREKIARTSLSSPLPCPPVPPPTPSGLKYSNRSLKNLSSNKTTLSGEKERSCITATTLVRTKLREPMISLIESSKTKMLHRCYGKQNVKALPLPDGRKPNTNNVNCQPIGTKVKTVTKPIKIQQISINQQMKTIYENEQFDKCNSVAKLSVSKLPVTTEEVKPADSTKKRLSSPGTKTENEESSTIETTEQNFEISMNILTDEYLDQKSLILPTQKNSSDDISKTLEQHSSEQDNSLVQRLTSFWNKKLNVNGNEKTVSSDTSSVASSATYIVKSNSDNDIDDDNEKFNSLEITSNCGTKKKANSSEEKRSNSQQSNGITDEINVDKEIEYESELPEIKLGLMDELISVLKKKSDPSFIKGKKHDKSKNVNVIANDNGNKRNKQIKEQKENKKLRQIVLKKNIINNMVRTLNSNDNLSNISSEGYEACLEEEYSNDETMVEDNDEESNDNEDEDNDYEEECDEETIEAIQTCLMRRITVRNFKTKSLEDLQDEDGNDDHDDDDDDDDDDDRDQVESSHTLTSDDSFREYQSNSSEKDRGSIARDSEDTDSFKDDDSYKEQNNEMKDNDEIIDDVIAEEVPTETERPNSNGTCLVNSLFNDNKDKITATIMNVNDIIVNLRNLIYTIETIPDELKVINMDLNSLPIPEEIKQTLTLIVDNSLTKGFNNDENDMFMLSDCLKKSSNCIDNQTSYSEEKCSNKIVESCKREGSLVMCHFPSTFTMPTIETVINPIELIFFPTRNEFIHSKINLIRSQNGYSTSEISGMIFNEGIRVDHQVEDEERTSNRSGGCDSKHPCVSKIVSKSHSPYLSVFYGTVGQNKVLMKAIPSVIFHPRKKSIKPLSTDLTTEPNKGSEMYVDKETFKTGEQLSTSSDYHNLPENKKGDFPPKNADKGDNECNNANGNCNIRVSGNDTNNVCLQENAMNFGDTALSGELNFNRFLNCNGTGRRRRLWRQANVEEDITVLTGGAGDYSGVTNPFPCHRTSSMSVIVSSSVNDSNSQTDIHLLESDCRVRSSTGHVNTVSRSQTEADNLSCNVIHEISEESASDIDDCVMIAAHQKQEMKTSDLLVLPRPLFESLHEDESGMINENKHTKNCNDVSDKSVLAKYDGKSSLLVDQTTSVTGLEVCKKLSVRDFGTMVDSSISDCYSETSDNSTYTNKTYNRNYVVMCCNTTAPSKVKRIFEQKTVNKIYNLDTVLKGNPDLKEELSTLIDISSLCDKEKQLIAVCLVLLRENSYIINKPFLEIVLERLGETACSLWNITSEKLGRKIVKVKKRLRIKCQTHTEFLISCQYKQLIKIIYTTLVSLLLCFIIQKNFCGISLPISFPW